MSKVHFCHNCNAKHGISLQTSRILKFSKAYNQLSFQPDGISPCNMGFWGRRWQSLGPELYYDKSRKPPQACKQWWSQKRLALILHLLFIHQAFVHEKNKEEHRRIWLKEGMLAKEFDQPTGSTGNARNQPIPVS